MDLKDCEAILRKCWSAETSSDSENWSPHNPAWGQCAVTAAVIQDFFGGDLMRGIVEINNGIQPVTVSHYWNRLANGQEVDLTREQFPFSARISVGEIRSRRYIFSNPHTLSRYSILRLKFENELRPNPLFFDEVYRLCFGAAQLSDCSYMQFGCVVFQEGKKQPKVMTSNRFVEPIKFLCSSDSSECIRKYIKSEQNLMIGACGHAEEWALKELREKKIHPDRCSFYVAGVMPFIHTPLLREKEGFSCLRCAVQLYMHGVKKIYIPVQDHWSSQTPEEALISSLDFAIGRRQI